MVPSLGPLRLHVVSPRVVANIKFKIGVGKGEKRTEVICPSREICIL